MIPPALRAHLDDEAPILPRPTRESIEICGGRHTAAATRQTRTEDESDVAQIWAVADGTRATGRHRGVERDAHQFELRVTYVLRRDVAVSVASEEAAAVEPVVDRPGAITWSPLSSLARNLHAPKGTDAAVCVIGRPSRIPPARPPIDHDGGVSSETPSPTTTRRHPSAGNLGQPEPVPRKQPARTARIPSIAYPLGAAQMPDLVRLGPDLDEAAMAKMVGHLDGRRILELGCGFGSNSVAMAMAGARVLSVDSSAERLGAARRLADEHEVSIEFHHGDLADLAFERADRVDLCLAVYSLAEVGDISRVFRQVHRVLRSEAPLLISLPHPLRFVARPGRAGSVGLVGSYVEEGTEEWSGGGSSGSVVRHGIGDVVTTLFRSNFRVDTLIEPLAVAEEDSPYRSPLDETVPSTFIVRGRKEGT